MKHYTDEDIRAILQKLIEKDGLRHLARQLGYSAQFVSDVARGNRAPSATFCTSLGFELIVSYRKIEQASASQVELGSAWRNTRRQRVRRGRRR